MVSKFGYGALISLGITVFSTISTIIPVLINSGDVTKDNNINYEITRLGHTLGINTNKNISNIYDDYNKIFDYYKRNITETINTSQKSINPQSKNYKNYTYDDLVNNKISICPKLDNKIKQNLNKIDIFFYILALREGKETDIKPNLYCDVQNKPVEHNDLSWYPLRQILLIENNANFTKAFHTDNTKEDFFCDELTNSKLCSFGEIKNILETNKNNKSLIEIVNKNPHSDIIDNTAKLASFIDYF